MLKWLASFSMNIKTKHAVLYTLLFIAVFITINFSSIGVKGLLVLTGGNSILDFEFGYTADKAYHMLTALGEGGRSFYVTKILPMDFLFPITYMLFYTSWIIVLLRAAGVTGKLKLLMIVPILAMISDWIENIGILIMLANYPHLPAIAVGAASTFGMIKMSLIYANMSIILILALFTLLRRVGYFLSKGKA